MKIDKAKTESASNPERLENLSPKSGSTFLSQDSMCQPKVFIKTFG